MKNKKKFIYLIVGIAFLLFVALYLIINYSEPNVLDSKDKKWISENGGKIISIDVINDIPIYSNNGKGVIFDFLDYIHKETNLEFNKIPHLKDGTSTNSLYKFEIIDGSTNLSSNQLLIFDDYYVSVSKLEMKINNIYDLAGSTLGLLESDSSNINYYLTNVNNVKYKANKRNNSN